MCARADTAALAQERPIRGGACGWTALGLRRQLLGNFLSADVRPTEETPSGIPTAANAMRGSGTAYRRLVTDWKATAPTKAAAVT